jgi:hypothetical protein
MHTIHHHAHHQRALSPFKFGPGFKKRLEEHFHELKLTTEGGQAFQLSIDHRIWLVDLVQDIIKHVEGMPDTLRDHIDVTAGFLQGEHAI